MAGIGCNKRYVLARQPIRRGVRAGEPDVVESFQGEATQIPAIIAKGDGPFRQIHEPGLVPQRIQLEAHGACAARVGVDERTRDSADPEGC